MMKLDWEGRDRHRKGEVGWDVNTGVAPANSATRELSIFIRCILGEGWLVCGSSL